jgi:hypothetical protein
MRKIFSVSFVLARRNVSTGRAPLNMQFTRSPSKYESYNDTNPPFTPCSKA